MTDTLYDVTGIGNAIVDILMQTDDAFLTRHGIGKGTMTLIDTYRAEQLLAAMHNPIEASGGSAGNTMAGIASLGGRAAFLGKVREDRLGEVFIDDMKRMGVHFYGKPLRDGPATARSHILVTPDGQRSMNTYLGCSAYFDSADIDEHTIRSSHITYIEGYLWDMPDTKAAMRRAIEIAKLAKRRVAFTLSDPFCVGRWRTEFLGLMEESIDILFANEAEIKALYETKYFDEAFQRVRDWGRTAAITRSEQGSVLTSKGAVHIVEAAPTERVLDTTGAGDLYAAGVLYGLASGLPLTTCGRLGSLAAAECIAHIGPRPQASLKALAAAEGLL